MIAPLMTLADGRREAFQNRQPTMLFRCQRTPKPGAGQCQGAVRIDPNETRGQCPTCSTWHGRGLSVLTDPDESSREA